MSSLTRLAFLVFAALNGTNIGLTKQPATDGALTYRNPRTLIELVSDSETIAQNLPAPAESDEQVQEQDQDLSELKKFFLDDPRQGFGAEDRLSEDRNLGDRRADRADSANDRDAQNEPNTDSQDAAIGRAEAKRFAALPSIRSVSINAPISAGILPENYAGEVFSTRPSEFQPIGYQRPDSYQGIAQWTAPWVAYRPLYFEDVWLERHGYHCGHLQPFVSAAKFYGRLPLIPYMKGVTPPTECVYSLGLGRPGDCTPYYCTLPKKSKWGLLYQAAYTAGAVVLIP